MTKVTQMGETVKFMKSASYILDKSHNMVAKATKVENLSSSSITMSELILLREQTRKRICGTRGLGI